MNIKFIGVKQLLIVSLLTTMTLNAKVCKETNRDGSTVTYKTTSSKCDWTHKTELVYKYKNGKIKSKQHYIDNVENGTSKSYFENGKLKSISTFKNGNLDGVVKNYHKNGKLSSEASYKNATPIETHKRYYEDGNLHSEITYKNGKKIVEKAYYNSGVIKSETTHKYTETLTQIVTTKSYFPSGKIKEIYIDTRMYATNGTPLNSGKDTRKAYTEDGKLIRDFTIVDNKQSGFETLIGKRGYKRRREITYKNGEQVSKKEFDNNMLSRETSSENGKRQSDKSYSYDKDEKLTRIYDRLTKKITYYKPDGSIDRVE